MAHFHIKKKKGRPYLYVREIARVGGKPKVISQTYIGSPERVAAMATGEIKQKKMLRVEEFGALWLAQQMDSDVDLAGIVDEVVPPVPREKGPSVGEYFLYCVFNRMVEARSKNRLAEWYRTTAIQHIRPVEIEELTSMRYWEKWNRVTEQALETIAQRFFKRIWELEDPEADCLLFDTTNYYTFMASDTKSNLARRGNNKSGRHHLRQIGLGLLVARKSRLPLYYRAYPGNLHDSKLFHEIMDEMFGVVCGLQKTKERLTVVIDKGMNSEGNYAWIDGHSRIHFVTTYSTYFAEDLAATPLEKFEPVDIEKNRRLIKDGKPEECLLAYRTRGEYWGKERAVVVTHNPATARKQTYTLDAKLDALRQELLEMRARVRQQAPHWRNPEVIQERYHRLCKRCHISSDLYAIEFSSQEDRLSMSFHKDAYRVQRKRAAFGRNIIITDNTDWTAAEIVQASLDRWQVEDRFRLSKDDELVSAYPMRHWTDSKIRCHLFTCVAAMTYLRRLELNLQAAGIKRSASSVMDEMRRLHSVLTMDDGRSKPRRRLETPTKTQAEVLSALGHYVDTRGVLQRREG
ncbi:MAG: IS1634 family transposase [Desulfobacteraceae bacterium]|nr:IS1634 family transposase [Desulfobacteraceae bacterium]